MPINCANAQFMTPDYISGGCAGGVPDEAMAAMARATEPTVRVLYLWGTVLYCYGSRWWGRSRR